MHAMSNGVKSALGTKDEGELQYAFSSTVCQVDYRVRRRHEDGTILDGVNLGGLDIFQYETPVARGAIRTVGHIRADHVDNYLLSLPLQKDIELLQGGIRTRVEPGYFAFLSTSKPFESACLSDGHIEYLIRVSGPLLRQRIPYIDDYCAHKLQILPGSGAMMQSLFNLALVNAKALPQSCTVQLGKAVIETIANAALEASGLGTVKRAYRKPAHERIRDGAMEYIECHLANPDLSVEEIANHCKISTRSLHAAFAVASISVLAHVREQRLQRCREALSNPAMRDKSIIEIAMKWGFNDASHFSHVYRSRFGCSPSDDRIDSTT